MGFKYDSDAAFAGANAVKFQSYSAKGLVNPKIDKDRFDHFDKFTLKHHEWKLLKDKATDDVDFLSSIGILKISKKSYLKCQSSKWEEI